jgi:hypothetical protein
LPAKHPEAGLTRWPERKVCGHPTGRSGWFNHCPAVQPDQRLPPRADRDAFRIESTILGFTLDQQAEEHRSHGAACRDQPIFSKNRRRGNSVPCPVRLRDGGHRYQRVAPARLDMMGGIMAVIITLGPLAASALGVR